MINKYIKLFLSIAITAYAVFQFTEGNIGNGIALVLLAGVILFFYFKNEFLLLAFWKLRSQDFAGSEKWLTYIKNPSSALVKNQQGYYYFLQGLITSQQNLTKSEKLFRKALSLGLNMKHDIAMAKMNLASIAMTKRRKREASSLLNEAKKLDSHGMFAGQIKQLKDQLKRM